LLDVLNFKFRLVWRCPSFDDTSWAKNWHHATLPLYSSVTLIYLLITQGVPGYPTSYPVGYPNNELPDNGSPNCNQ